MKQLDLKAVARADLADILEYSVSEFGRRVAAKYMRGLSHAFTRLEEYPEIGPLSPDIAPEIRLLRYRNHHIFYRIEGDLILVMRVLHHAMDAKGRLKN